MQDNWVQVAAGIVFDNDGQILVSSRPAGKPYAGYWEFAGGKLEAGESPFDALVREFDEELGICITQARRWLVRRHRYEHAAVCLHIFRIEHDSWHGEIQSREGQSWRWCNVHAAQDNMLPANLPLLRALGVPQLIRGRLPENMVWANGIPDDTSTADAALVRVGNTQDAQRLTSALQGGLPIPVLVCASDDNYNRFAPTWQQYGLHGRVILEDE